MRLSYGSGYSNMAGRCSIRLVIDVGVARSAGGEESTHERSKFCRGTLQAIIGLCEEAGREDAPCIVMTPAMYDEWNRHRSRFAQRWLRQMFARHRVIHPDSPQNNALRKRILRLKIAARDRDAILKDIHLVEAALATDKTILSLDKIIRDLLAQACQTIVELRPIIWVNPEISDEDAIGWLKSGAQPETMRRLDHWSKYIEPLE